MGGSGELSDQPDDIETRTSDLQDRIRQVREADHLSTAIRLSRELRRLAKSEQRIVDYLLANFYLMNDLRSIHCPEEGAEVAIETISLLESEERARAIQPDFPQSDYYRTVSWMSTCAYDNLAESVAERDGYNSPGMHDCINDGLEVCRRTGKLSCITCFREYASDVYRAADDLDMALHHARFVTSREDDSNDRRYVGHSMAASIHLLSGRLSAALEEVMAGFAVVDAFHHPLNAKRQLIEKLETVLRLQGREDAISDLLAKAGIEPDFVRVPSAGENPSLELRYKLLEILSLTLQGDLSTALRELSFWDRQLLRQRCLDAWFEVRLRMIALYLLSNQPSRAKPLIDQIEEKARAAHDWLTLRRLGALSNPRIPVSPVAAVAPMESGPYAASALPDAPIPTSGDAAVNADSDSKSTEAQDSESGPLAALAERLRLSRGDESLVASIFEDLVVLTTQPIADARDAAWIIHLTHLSSRFIGRELEAWQAVWPAVRPYLRDGVVMNVLADLGRTLRDRLQEGADQYVSTEQIDQWFRTSLELEPDHGRNFARAADYYAATNRTGEAERCFARAFRLDRSNGHLALSLAEIYHQSERPRDGLAVLDMAIREGAEDPVVFWQAGIIALSVEQYESAASYFARFEELQPGEAWTQYYRALALLESGRPGLAIAAIDQEAERSPAHRLPIAILRAWSCELLQRTDRMEQHLAEILDLPLSQVDYLTESGLTRLFERLYRVITSLSEDSILYRRIHDLILQSGLAPSALFKDAVEGEDVVDDLGYFVCIVRQPLGPEWRTFPGCLLGQESWTEYETAWGVLARDEEEAQEISLKWQRHCAPLPPEILDTRQQGEGYSGPVGIVWQGLHQQIKSADGTT